MNSTMDGETGKQSSRFDARPAWARKLSAACIHRVWQNTRSTRDRNPPHAEQSWPRPYLPPWRQIVTDIQHLSDSSKVQAVHHHGGSGAFLNRCTFYTSHYRPLYARWSPELSTLSTQSEARNSYTSVQHFHPAHLSYQDKVC